MKKSGKKPKVDSIASVKKRAGGEHTLLKTAKNRFERRAAKRDPEVLPGYGKYAGWML